MSNRSSKLSNLTEFKLQDYLSTNCLTLKQKRLLYQFRIRMVESFYDNFKNKFSSAEVSSKQCLLCFDTMMIKLVWGVVQKSEKENN